VLPVIEVLHRRGALHIEPLQQACPLFPQVVLGRATQVPIEHKGVAPAQGCAVNIVPSGEQTPRVVSLTQVEEPGSHTRVGGTHAPSRHDSPDAHIALSYARPSARHTLRVVPSRHVVEPGVHTGVGPVGMQRPPEQASPAAHITFS
jgi:hypothetical protein